MSGGHMDIERIKQVLKEATQPGAEFSQRGLAKKAGLGRDAVGDIINGRNKNPTMHTLTSLANALGVDLTVFGLYLTSEADLRRAIEEALPELPKRRDRQAQYLSEVVGRLIGLPQDRPAKRRGKGSGKTSPKEDEPPPSPTS